MKKQNLKLGLNKRDISNLSSIRGGFGPQTVSCTCPVIDTTTITAPGDCKDPDTQMTTCHGETKSRTCTVVTHCLCG
jgi:hypothetical protein